MSGTLRLRGFRSPLPRERQAQLLRVFNGWYNECINLQSKDIYIYSSMYKVLTLYMDINLKLPSLPVFFLQWC